MLKSTPESSKFARELSTILKNKDAVSKCEQLFLKHSPDPYWYDLDNCLLNRPFFYAVTGNEDNIETKVIALFLKYVPKVPSGMEKAYEEYKKNVNSFLTTWKERLSTDTKDNKEETMKPLIYELNGYLKEKYS